MASGLKKGIPLRLPLFGVAILLFCGAFAYRKHLASERDQNTRNYSLNFVQPVGWKVLPHSPEALFLFQDPQTKLLMRGAMNDVVADYNPTPDLDRDGTAQWLLDVTSKNLKGWTGEMLDTIDANGVSFRLVKRWTNEKCVISAIGVRGNTTVVVTLSADKGQIDKIDPSLPKFRTYLAGLGFQRHVWAE